jgi:GxxExxY protein
MNENELSKIIIGCAIKVHKKLGPGLLESIYEDCLAYELRTKNIAVCQQKAIPVIYENVQMQNGFRVDLLVDGIVVVELKSIECFAPIHTAQMITYLKLTGCKLGLLINFHVVKLENGIRRVVLNL